MPRTNAKPRRLTDEEIEDRRRAIKELHDTDPYLIELRADQEKYAEWLRKECPDYESLLKIASIFITSGHHQNETIKEYESLIADYQQLASWASFALKNNSALARTHFEELRSEFTAKLPDMIAIGAALQAKKMARRGAAGKRVKHTEPSKEVVRKLWLEWQSEPGLYKNKTAFDKATADIVNMDTRTVASWRKELQEKHIHSAGKP